MKVPSILEMLAAGVHFGHQTSRWHPKMKEYIYTERAGVHVIDLEKTTSQLGLVLAQIKEMTAQGKKILFVTTKPQAKEIVKSAAIDCGMPYLVNRWVGGLLTNFTESRRLIKKYLKLQEEQASGEWEKYTKKEQARLAKEVEKMDQLLAGLKDLEKLPDAVFLPSLHKEKTAVTEANRTKVAVIAICDTNSNPTKAAYVIPANDDATKSIQMIVGLVAEAVKEGRIDGEKRRSNEEGKK
jgi:small subunit ribosomal protein S2